MTALLLALLLFAQFRGAHQHPVDEEINNLVVVSTGIQFTMKKVTPAMDWVGQASPLYVVNVSGEVMSYRGAKKTFDDPGERDRVLGAISHYLGSLGDLVEMTCVLPGVKVSKASMVRVSNEPPHEMWVFVGDNKIVMTKGGVMKCPNAQVKLSDDDWARVMGMNQGAYNYAAESYHWWWDAPLRRGNIVR